jgi:hypothetical protein
MSRLHNPRALLAVSVAHVALSGCVYLPLPETPLETPSPSLGRVIGRGRPIRPGAVTREQVIEKLGPPDWRSADDTTLLYTSWVEGGTWIMLPFIPVSSSTHIVAARLDFGPDGVLRHTRLERGEPTPPSLLTRGPRAPPMVRELRAPQTQTTTTRPAATAPTSQ